MVEAGSIQAATIEHANYIASTGGYLLPPLKSTTPKRCRPTMQLLGPGRNGWSPSGNYAKYVMIDLLRISRQRAPRDRAEVATTAGTPQEKDRKMRHDMKRRGRKVATIAMSSALAVALTACSSGGSSSGGSGDWVDDLNPMTIRVADWTAGDADTGLYGQALEGFAERVGEATDGKVEFEFYWGTSLLSATDSLRGVGDGVADISIVNSVYYPSELPVGNWLSGLGANLTGSIVHDVAAGGATAYETAQTLEPLVEEWTANNVHPLMTVGSAPYNLICTEPLETLADAEGKKVRTAGETWTNTIEDLGMVPVSLSYNEIYEGLQRGVIDCVTINPNQLVSSLMLEDVAPYYHPVTFPLFQSTNFVMTLDVWEDLPPELQQVFHEEAAQAARDIWDRFIELESEAGEAISSEEVVQVVESSELDEAAATSRQEYVNSLAQSAPSEVPDPETVVSDYIALFDRWTNELVEEGHPIPERNLNAIVEAFEQLSGTDYTQFYETFVSEYVAPNAPS